MTVGSLFAGIGGFDLGLERAGMSVRWQVENNPWCQRVLAKHWPNVTRYGDIKQVDWHTVEPVDLVCGGFPCQPFSLAGKRKGFDDDRYLWPEVVRCLDAVRPTWFLGENVPGIIKVALDQVCADLESLGYTVQAFNIPACAVDAPHQRKRIWIVAHADGQRQRQPEEQADASRDRGPAWMGPEVCGCGRCELAPASDVADAARELPYGTGTRGGWEPEPSVGRVAHGIPSRVDRLRGLGNAVVPQMIEVIGKRIMEVEQQWSSV